MAHSLAQVWHESNATRIDNRELQKYLSRWDEKRWETCADFLVHVSVARRQFIAAAEHRLGLKSVEEAGPAPHERRALHLNAVAAYNRLRLISNSGEVMGCAAGMLGEMDEWLKLLAEEEIERDAFEALRDQYNGVRGPYINAVKSETGVLLPPPSQGRR